MSIKWNKTSYNCSKNYSLNRYIDCISGLTSHWKAIKLLKYRSDSIGEQSSGLSQLIIYIFHSLFIWLIHFTIVAIFHFSCRLYRIWLSGILSQPRRVELWHWLDIWFVDWRLNVRWKFGRVHIRIARLRFLEVYFLVQFEMHFWVSVLFGLHFVLVVCMFEFMIHHFIVLIRNERWDIRCVVHKGRSILTRNIAHWIGDFTD